VKKDYERAADFNETLGFDPTASYNSLAWLWATCPRRCRDGRRACGAVMMPNPPPAGVVPQRTEPERINA
jgi:hypothetical protein